MSFLLGSIAQMQKRATAKLCPSNRRFAMSRGSRRTGCGNRTRSTAAVVGALGLAVSTVRG
jgi:hypothetical protein